MDEQETVAPVKKRRFSAVSDADVASTEDARVPSSTKTATPFWVRVFKSFCDESGISIKLSTCSGRELNDVLCLFYLGVRNKKRSVLQAGLLPCGKGSYQPSHCSRTE